MVLLFTGCAIQNGNTNTTDSSAISSSVEDTTPETEPEEEVDYTIAYEGYNDENAGPSIVAGATYLNLFENRIYYTTPATKTRIPLEGNAQDWVVSEDKYNIVTLAEAQDGKYMFETSGTGYVYFKNATLNKIAKIYVNKPVERKEENKQTSEKFPYYLYLEKGSYTKFARNTIVLTVYRVDEEGYYTIPYLTISTACGAAAAKTPVGFHKIGGDDIGEFSMNGREYWHDWGGAYAQYCISYASGVYLHSTACGQKKSNTVDNSNYAAVGTHASGGCLRMQAGSVYWIWSHCPNGTTLEIVDGNPRGTRIEPNLGKGVTAGFDPTDPYLITARRVE